MMRKKIVSLCMALTLCLGLLPVTALAADGGTVYVGGVTLSGSTDSPAYATTDDNGTVTTVDASADKYNIKWDGSTLTLDGAKIKGGTSSESLYATVGIYAFSNSGDVSLNIALKDKNTITSGGPGIWVYSPDRGGAATLNITGENGSSLNASGGTYGIQVQSNSGDATLTIQNADVTAENSSSSGDGVQVRSSAQKSASLSVDGGSLTATGMSKYGAGIRYTFGSSSSGSGTPSLTVSGNAMVKASGGEGGIRNNSSADIQIGVGDNSSGGIVFDGNKGTVYGSVTLQEDLTIGEGESLTIPDGASLTIGNDATLTNEGTVTNSGTLTNNGTIDNSGTLTGTISGNAPPSITTTSLTDGTVGAAYNATLEASGDPTSWEITEGTLPAGLTLAESTGVISGTPTTAGTSTFTVKAESSYGSDSKELTLTINPAPVLVTSVALNKSELSLYTGQSEILTATVQPSNATNQNVTWSSDKPDVATVDAAGKVTAVGAGTATITVTTADGNHTATCTVTVTRPYIPPANPNYRITVEATQGGAVTADPTAAKAGTSVTLTPVPDRGYQVGSVAVTDRFGDPVAVTEQADGTYTFTMPNGQVTVTVTFEQAPLPFPDVTEGDWFYDAVRYAYENSLMDGVGDSLFAPNSETTRAQLVTILYRLAGEPEVSGTSGFSDVAAGTWYTDAVAWAAQNGIVNGVSDTEFAPGDDITREQLVTVLYRYAESKGYDVSASADLSGYPDAGQVQDYAQPAMAWAVAEGIVEGMDGTLNPAGNATRAQIATILMRFLAAVPTA